MNITDKQAVEAAGVLITHCYGTICAECMWHKGSPDCMLRSSTPRSWAIPTLPAEPAPAEPDKPHLCEILGVVPGERLDVLREDGSVWLENVWVAENGIPYVVSAENEDCSSMIDTWAFADVIEIAAKHPDRIRRKPKIVLTDDDKAVVRRWVEIGYPWAARNSNGFPMVFVYNEKPLPENSDGEFSCTCGMHAVLPEFMPWAEAGVLYYLPDLVGGGWMTWNYLRI